MAVPTTENQDTDSRFSRLDRDDGQTMVEYGFVLVAVALVAIAAFQAFGGRVSALVDTIAV